MTCCQAYPVPLQYPTVMLAAALATEPGRRRGSLTCLRRLTLWDPKRAGQRLRKDLLDVTLYPHCCIIGALLSRVWISNRHARRGCMQESPRSDTKLLFQAVRRQQRRRAGAGEAQGIVSISFFFLLLPSVVCCGRYSRAGWVWEQGSTLMVACSAQLDADRSDGQRRCGLQ